MKAIVIAGTKSGSGKTTIALALMASLVRRGLLAGPFKVGPDFIDPGHHSKITGRVSRNLDGWMLSKEYNRQVFRKRKYMDIAVIEGVMGLFDGYDGKSEAGSTAQMAKWLNLPIILIVDAKSMARSAAALVQGFECFDESLCFAGVIFNNIGTEKHLIYLKEALLGNVKMPCLGGIPNNSKIAIPERHLGLVTQDEYSLTEKNINKLADLIDENIDMDALLNSLPDLNPVKESDRLCLPSKKAKVRIGIARDKAFCFYYQDNLDMLEKNGANLVYFSPIKDKFLPENLHGIYFGGGYPEVFAKQLADNSSMRKSIKEKSQKGMPIYGECGGFMYLCKELCDTDGNIYPMTECFPFTASMSTKLKSLGYREVELKKDTIIGKSGWKIKGHEFHYSEIIEQNLKNIETVYNVSKRTGLDQKKEGYIIANTLGSYNHLHFGSNSDAAAAFVEACRLEKGKYSETR
ncbi:Cobyrinate a,c-diamide synthase [Candidatus Magnetomoraceae bacterium gMMP-1]